ncbi:hypothetical protein SAMN02745163_04469 [Clostridium cavendishii DSM 21758]|uniref:DUF4367 domain-containing protein n=1 Tax=Clostridium cavendishii DSM 21758 TaxID=1121302 RepID=A0A1M6VCF1_9CLOT|nr:hypothetical protein [Clostridium cavendishii]SHK79061.1 hypothetical protein SAMN02745163_04469 [Clostridium cavendishii DSM 21758]
MKNILKILTLFLILGIVFQGCTDLESSKREAKHKATSDKAVQRVGETNYGFVDIPSDWKKFKDIDISTPIIQYSDKEGKSIITLNMWEKKGQDTKTVASSLFKKIESEGAENVKGATVKIGDNEALQVYGVYPKDGVMIVMWIFEKDDGYIHYVSVEGSKDEIMEIVERTEKSFSLEK